MRIVLVLIIITTSLFAKGQQITPTDSLKKYSYYLMGILWPNQQDSVMRIFSGTCFFIKRDTALFLITAKHVLTGCKNGEKPLRYPDYFNVMPTPYDSLRLPLGIPFIENKIIKDTASCLLSEDDPDVIAIPIDKKWINSVNTVNEYLCPPFKRFGHTEIFGFPRSGNKKNELPVLLIHILKKELIIMQ